MNAAKQAMHLQINGLRNLPALPEVSLKILAAVNDSDISIGKLVNTIALSPSLVARLLGLANSAYFGQERKLNDLHQAIVQVLGLDLVKSLTLGVILNVHLDPRKCEAFNSEYYWLHSLMTALAVQKIADCGQLPFSKAQSYNAGLLLDIGVLVLAYLQPLELDTVLKQCANENSSISGEIQKRIGLSHFEVGSMLMEKWKLPSFYQLIVDQFENPDYQGDAMPMIVALKAAKYLSAEALKGADQLAENHRFSMLAQSDLNAIYRELRAERQTMQTLAFVLGSH